MPAQPWPGRQRPRRVIATARLAATDRLPATHHRADRRRISDRPHHAWNARFTRRFVVFARSRLSSQSASGGRVPERFYRDRKRTTVLLPCHHRASEHASEGWPGDPRLRSVNHRKSWVAGPTLARALARPVMTQADRTFPATFFPLVFDFVGQFTQPPGCFRSGSEH